MLGRIISILSFPAYSLEYSSGIDNSLIWVYNYLFSIDIELAKNILFPHGALAFFMYPLVENFWLAIAVTFLLKTMLLASFVELAWKEIR